MKFWLCNHLSYWTCWSDWLNQSSSSTKKGLYNYETNESWIWHSNVKDIKQTERKGRKKNRPKCLTINYCWRKRRSKKLKHNLSLTVKGTITKGHVIILFIPFSWIFEIQRHDAGAFQFSPPWRSFPPTTCSWGGVRDHRVEELAPRIPSRSFSTFWSRKRET